MTNWLLSLFLWVVGMVAIFTDQAVLGCICFVMCNQMVIFDKLERLRNGN